MPVVDVQLEFVYFLVRQGQILQPTYFFTDYRLKLGWVYKLFKRSLCVISYNNR